MNVLEATAPNLTVRCVLTILTVSQVKHVRSRTAPEMGVRTQHALLGYPHPLVRIKIFASNPVSIQHAEKAAHKIIALFAPTILNVGILTSVLSKTALQKAARQSLAHLHLLVKTRNNVLRDVKSSNVLAEAVIKPTVWLVPHTPPVKRMKLVQSETVLAADAERLLALLARTQVLVLRRVLILLAVTTAYNLTVQSVQLTPHVPKVMSALNRPATVGDARQYLVPLAQIRDFVKPVLMCHLVEPIAPKLTLLRAQTILLVKRLMYANKGNALHEVVGFCRALHQLTVTTRVLASNHVKIRAVELTALDQIVHHALATPHVKPVSNARSIIVPQAAVKSLNVLHHPTVRTKTCVLSQ